MTIQGLARADESADRAWVLSGVYSAALQFDVICLVNVALLSILHSRSRNPARKGRCANVTLRHIA